MCSTLILGIMIVLRYMVGAFPILSSGILGINYWKYLGEGPNGVVGGANWSAWRPSQCVLITLVFPYVLHIYRLMPFPGCLVAKGNSQTAHSGYSSDGVPALFHINTVLSGWCWVWWLLGFRIREFQDRYRLSSCCRGNWSGKQNSHLRMLTYL